MVIAYHLIATAYGWWLPNEPRGSMSREIRSDVLRDLGDIHFERKKIQPNGRTLRDFHRRSESLLKHPLLEFDLAARRTVAVSFAETIAREGYACYAYVQMRDHFHICIRKHRQNAEQITLTLQEFSRRALIAVGLRSKDHPVWGGPGWKVFLDDPQDVRRTIAYVEENPLKVGWNRQVHPFVTQYDNWPLHKSPPRNRKR